MVPSQIAGLHHELSIKKDMLIKLCARNYITSYGLVNGANESFINYTKTFSKITNMDMFSKPSNWNQHKI
jgi:hypothetical protein